MTIEERAKKHACFKTNRITAYASYIKGAKEQQEIDIQRAVEYLCGECTSKCEHICMICNRKNELIKAMKGE